MTEDPIIELISKQSMARLNEMERDLEQQEERARYGLDVVRRAKAMKKAPRIASDVLVRASQGTAASAEVKVLQNGNGRGNKREPIKRIMAASPERAWRPGEMSRALAEQGIELSRDGARVTMNRMVEENELVKLGQGGAYVLASQNGSADHQASANGRDPEAEGRETVLG